MGVLVYVLTKMVNHFPPLQRMRAGSLVRLNDRQVETERKREQQERRNF